MMIAHMAGVGVQPAASAVLRGMKTTADISAGLEALHRLLLWSFAGIKSILDSLTLEYLETKGVPMIYQTGLPAFYTRKSSFSLTTMLTALLSWQRSLTQQVA